MDDADDASGREVEPLPDWDETTRRNQDEAHVSALLIHQLLRRLYAGTRFSVRIHNRQCAPYVVVRWWDGPSRAEVAARLAPYASWVVRLQAPVTLQRNGRIEVVDYPIPATTTRET
jgi:hypothetical protein